ncbi:MAG: NAD-dependent epimerase/dehydratase family protein [Deltaproteobacteria bacterium]|nr:NAD-dependent epimerase/dehydratase family protein [Deltaproteobacteria bacterium]
MKALVTGGHGFLGAEIVRQLRALGHEATPVSRQSGVDITEPGSLRAALAGHDTVFHVAALAGVWGRRQDFERTNVEGTRNVLAACRDMCITRIIYTSSPSVTFDGADHLNASNDLPYPARWLADYPRTKAEAERLVLAANDGNLATVALRPHLIYGPGDPHLLPRLLARARAGRLRIVGAGDNLVSLSFVENAASAHVAAALALAPGAACAGKAYFVNDAEPVRVWDWLNEVFAGLGLPAVTRRVPAGVAYAAGALLEGAWSLLGLGGEPPMTRFVARQLSTSHTYDLGPARRDLGWTPAVSGREAQDRTIAALRPSEPARGG